LVVYADFGDDFILGSTQIRYEFSPAFIFPHEMNTRTLYFDSI
jgi:hypothetical protein